MGEFTEELKRALAGRYQFERELGRGGVANVYLARDVEQNRLVAVKVLRPESAALIGTERFLLEVGVAASLEHPHILPLYDSGQVSDLMYYVMPYVEGGSLADRMEREERLPIEDALAIVGDVGDALTYAHERGFIHRDIKPENILLWNGRAVLSDFGIARAIDVADEARLTQTGLIVGTPVYMSPEQAAGSRILDGRSDIYSLGCVLYEMLVGEAPYTGPNVQAVLARHAVDPIPAIRTVRDTVSPTIEKAVVKAMAKTPADRFKNAAEFIKALHAPSTDIETVVLPTASPALRFTRTKKVFAILALLVVVIAASASIVQFRKADSSALDDNLIALMPFRVHGVPDSGFVDLGRGIHELLYVRVNGALGMRAVYPGTGAQVWEKLAGGEEEISEEVELQGAAELGAGKLLRGHLFWTGSRLILNATLLSVPDGIELVSTGDVPGPRDSVVSLVDQLAALLLTQRAGVRDQLLADLVTQDLDALKAYLVGREAFKRSEFTDAVEWFSRALDIDSTFALAGVGLATSYTFIGSGGPLSRGLRLASNARDQLGSADQLFFDAFAGPRYPDRATHAEDIAAWEAVVEVIPDRADIQFQYGDMLMHWGPLIGIPQSLERAGAAFRRSFELDSLSSPTISHLLELAAHEGDTAATSRYGVLYLAGEEPRSFSDYYRWRIATVLDDTSTLESIRQRFSDLDMGTLDRILVTAQTAGVGVNDAESAAEAIRRKAASPSDLRDAYDNLRFLALNRGQPEQAAAFFRAGREIQQRPNDALAAVVEALFWEGDEEIAEEILAAGSEVASPHTQADLTGAVYHDLCASLLWRLGHQELGGVEDGIARLRTVEPERQEYITGYVGLCAATVEAQLAALLGSFSAASSLESLDSLLRVGALSDQWTLAAANLVTARLLEARGDIPSALISLSRRPYGCCGSEVMLSTFLREEARLAALEGFRDRAISSYDHYLSLRSDPEAQKNEEIALVRSELRELIEESR